MYRVEVRYEIGKGQPYSSIYRSFGYESEWSYWSTLDPQSRHITCREFGFSSREDAEAFIDVVTSISPDGLLALRRLY